MQFDDVKKAIEREEIELWFQPIVSLSDLNISGFEGLVRWRHPSEGVLGPGSFIEHALSDDLCEAFNELVILQAIRFAQRTAAWPQVKVSINFTANDLLESKIPARIQTHLATHDVSAKKIAIEITESDTISYTETESVFNELSQMGISLSVDDFGTGYASLTHVKHIPLSTLKIDRSFVLAMEECSEDYLIVENACNLGNSLHVDVIAEGIERAEQLDILKLFDCTHGQGFYFSPAVPGDEAVEMLANRNQFAVPQAEKPVSGPKAEVRLETSLESMEEIINCSDCQSQLGLGMLEFVPLSVFLKSANGRFVWSNSYHRLISLTNNAVYNPAARDIHPIEEAQSFRADDLRVTSTGEALIGRREPCTVANGRRAELVTTKIPIYNSDGLIVGILGFCNDDDTASTLAVLHETGDAEDQSSDAVCELNRVA